MKVCFMPLGFSGRTVFVPVFTDPKKSEGDFHFYKEKEKVKSRIVFSICFAAAVTEAVFTLGSESGSAELLTGNHTQHLSIKLPEL